MKSNSDILEADNNNLLISESNTNMSTVEQSHGEDDWKIIQKNTFTRWVNVHLKTCNQSIENLQNDFSDGLKLIALIEVLSGQKFPHINKKPNFRTQKLENVTMVLQFLTEHEGVKLVNIDSAHIVDSNLKLILGLIWTLILHYAISMPVWGEENDKEENKQTPKQRMLTWFNTKMVDRPVKNLTTDWNDGTAIGALVDSCAPGLCPDWDQWKPNRALENTKDAMETAEKWLNVPQLIRPEEMIDSNVDEKAMMTYLSQFPNAKLNPAAPLRPKLNPSKVRVYGPGVESKDLAIGQSAEFTVDAFSAGRAHLNVEVIDSNGHTVEVKVEEIKEKNGCYKCSYIPLTRGLYKISVKYNDQEVPHSPFDVVISKSPSDASKVTVYGPGVEKVGLTVKESAEFTICTEHAGDGNVTCVIIDQQGDQTKVSPKITQTSSTTYKVEYLPRDSGFLSINVLYGNKQVPNSPFGVQISQKSNAKMIIVTGRGIQSNGIRVGDCVEFQVNTEDAGEGDLEVVLEGPNKVEETVKITKINPNYYQCTYIPSKTGLYELKVNYDGVPVQRSPFKINVRPTKTSNISAYGPGLKTGVVDKPATFVTDTNGELGSLGFSIEGPSEAKIECCDNQDGSATMCYWPTVEGEYAVHILCDGEDIRNSPFIAKILPKTNKTDVSKINVYGNGVQNGKVYLRTPSEFIIDCGEYESDIVPEASCYSGNGAIVPVNMIDAGDRKYKCTYEVERVGNHKVFVTCDQQSLQKSPYKLIIEKPSDPSSIRVIGEGIKVATRNVPARFSIDTTHAGRGNLAVELCDEMGNSVPLEINTDNDPEIFDVKYQPKTGGPTYKCSVYFDGLNVPGSPFHINVKPDINVNAVVVDHIEPRVFQQSFMRFKVNTRAIDSSGTGNVSAIFTDSSNNRTASTVKNNADGTYDCSYSAQIAGVYTLDITYDGLPTKNSPYKVEVVPGCDPSKVTVYGDGLKGGLTNQPNYFTIDVGSAGQGELGFGINGLSETAVHCSDNHDGTCTIEYSAPSPGTYNTHIKFNDQDIIGSPFKLNLRDPINPENVKCYGPAMNAETPHRLGSPAKFVIDASRAGEAPIKATCTNSLGKEIPLALTPRENLANGIFEVTLNPLTEGPHTIDIKLGDTQIPSSPFTVNIRPKSEPEKVKVYGEGVNPANGYLLPSEAVKFRIDTFDAGSGEIELSLKGPNGQMMPIHMTTEPRGVICCEYTPLDAGRYTVNIAYNDVAVPNSPFIVEVIRTGDASRCFIEDTLVEYMLIETETIINVDTSDAGEGKLSCQVSPVSESGEILTRSALPVEIKDDGNGSQCISFTPVELGNYLVDIKYGGINIPSGKFELRAIDPNNLPEDLMEMAKNKNENTAAFDEYDQIFYPVEFRLPISEESALYEAIIVTPGGQQEKAYVEDNGDDSIIVRYEPKERGMHDMIVSCDKVALPEPPYHFFAENVGIGKVCAYGPGLCRGKTGNPCEFSIITKDSGAGEISLAIEGPSKAEIQCSDNDNGRCDVTFHPTLPGDYSIIIKFGDKDIAGSPFVANISGEPQIRSQICIGNTSDVPLKIENLDISTLTASVKSPSGQEEPCILKQMINNSIGISFTPKEVGEHHVSVYQSGSHIFGSPFKILVGENEIGDASKVKVYGDGLKNGRTNLSNSFTVDTREAGYGGLSLSIEGPSKADIECRDNYDSTCQVSYRPSEPGTYVVNIKYANEHVKGSPFSVNISGEPSAKLTEKIVRQTEAADITHIGSLCELTLKVIGANPGDMKATVTNETGLTESCEIIDIGEGHYVIKFVPKETGLHTVVVKHRNVDIAGSPFKFTVGPIVDGGAHKVSASGSGLKYGRVNEYNEFSIYTREAGAGGLSIAVDGASKAEINFEDRKDGSCGVKYRVTEAGEYCCSIKFNEVHIANSPFRIFITDQLADYVSVASVGSNAFAKDLTIGKPAALTVNHQYSVLTAKLKAIIKGPSVNEEAGVIQNIEKNQFAIRFIPKESGEHLVSVIDEATDQHIAGSPFRVVIGSQVADPSMVHARGNGLSQGFVGSKSSFIISTVNCGSGALNVTIDGPSKVKLYSQEHEEGYQFFYIPEMAGKYTIAVKYGGNYHIPGSPFTADIKRATVDEPTAVFEEQCYIKVENEERTYTFNQMRTESHANRVKSNGLGLQEASLHGPNTFKIDASEAGNDILLVGIAGPKSQCKEVSVKHTGNNQFVVNYMLQEKGRHYLVVKWGEKDIPGSPFIINVD